MINSLSVSDSIELEYKFDASKQRIWEAITQKNQMTRWFFEMIPEFKPEVGFSVQFQIKNESRNFTHLWKITEVIPCKKITFQWRYKEYIGDSLVTFFLSETKKTTHLLLKIQILESFPKNIPEFSVESCKNGWNYFLDDRLRNYLKKEIL